MFDMKSIGRRIALMRKEVNLTQMELADMLNISFQAVSNWERGETMPDISKLPELGKIFNVSIDRILDSKKSSEIIENVIGDKKFEREITTDDFKSIAPILKPDQIKYVLSDQINNILNDINIDRKINDMIEFLPFVSRETADKIAQKSIKRDQIEIDEFLPFVSRHYADLLVLEAIEKNKPNEELTRALPFVSQKVADKIAQKAINSDIIEIDEFLPFIIKHYADLLISKAIEKNYPVNHLTEALSFVSRETADKIAQKAIENNQIDINKFLPFVSRHCADLLVSRVIEKDDPK